MKYQYLLNAQGKEITNANEIAKGAVKLHLTQDIMLSQENKHDREYIVAFGFFDTVGRVDCYYTETTKSYESYYIDKKTANRLLIDDASKNPAGFDNQKLAEVLKSAISKPFDVIVVQYHTPDETSKPNHSHKFSAEMHKLGVKLEHAVSNVDKDNFDV